MEKLLELGFKKIGSWKKIAKELSFEISEFKDSTDIIFAFVQNSSVVYMAVSNENFEIFLNTFINPSVVELDKINVKNCLLKSLDNNNVEIYALRNKKFFGLMTKFSPIEISNLMKEINPAWNSLDLKNRMKNIVGKDRNAVLKSEKEKLVEVNKEITEVPKKEKPKKEYETYIFILAKSYYERGFFNLKTSYSHLVGEDKADIQIIVEDKKVIHGKISRTANVSNTARIIGNKALKMWFQENAQINSELKITFISKKKIKLEIA